MHRIDGPGHVSNKFSEGDPTGSPPTHPTIVTMEIMNALQQEMCRCIEYSGATLNTSAETDPYNQLVDAVGQSWVAFNIVSGTPTELDSRNFDSFTDNGTGDYTIDWDENYTDTNYNVLVSVGDGTNSIWATVEATGAGSCRVRVFNSGGAYETATMVVCVRASGTVAV
jgi:hypothetical protein